MTDRQVFDHSNVSRTVCSEYGWDVARDGMPKSIEDLTKEDLEDGAAEAATSKAVHDCGSRQEYVVVQKR